MFDFDYDLEESYLLNYSEPEAEAFTHGTLGIYLCLVNFLAHVVSPILRYGESPKITSFGLLGFSQDKYLCSFFLCGCAYLSFSDILAYGYDVIMLNVIRSEITIKNSTWYHIYHERSLCATETVLQLQLLKIRVSRLKTLKDKNY